jgi:hypothetical protein
MLLTFRRQGLASDRSPFQAEIEKTVDEWVNKKGHWRPSMSDRRFAKVVGIDRAVLFR